MDQGTATSSSSAAEWVVALAGPPGRLSVAALAAAVSRGVQDVLPRGVAPSSYYAGHEQLEAPVAHAWLAYAILRDGVETEVQVTAVDAATGLFVVVLTATVGGPTPEVWDRAYAAAKRIGRALELGERALRQR